MSEQYGFGGKLPTPLHDGALEYAEAILNMVRCAERLEEAKSNAPDYTAQWDASDYYAEEQNAFNVAANELWALVK